VHQAGSFHIRLLDSQDSILADYPITLTKGMDSEAEPPVYSFVATFPAPSETVARIELLKDDVLLHSRAPGTSVPTIVVVKPAGGESFDQQMQLVWQASDADTDDTLLYAVQYSPDNGQSWTALLTSFPGPPDSTTVRVDLLDLGIPGSNLNEGLIRVAASDGYNTGLATSAAFTVSNRAPEPYIVSPIEGETTAADRAALLSGDAIDAEDGGLSGDSLEWTVDGQAGGTGEQVLLYGLAPGDYQVELTARDSAAQEATADTVLTILPLDIPAGVVPLFNGLCNDPTYDNGTELQLAPYSDGAQATVRLLRADNYLWACFTGLERGSEDPGAFVGIRVDANCSRDPFAQTDDYGFFVGEDGGYFSYAGDGSGGFDDPGPGGVQAQVSANENGWNAELRVGAAVLGGWDNAVGLSLGHYWVNAQQDDYAWPYAAAWNQPNTWAKTALSSLPQIDGLVPISTTAGGPDFTLEVVGENFVDGATVLWNGTALPTSFDSSSAVTADVSAAHIATAGTVEIIVRNPGSDNLDSNPAFFEIRNPVPHIDSLSPDAVEAGSIGFTLVVNGSSFVDGASLLWNGEAYSATYVDDTQLTVQIGAEQVAHGGAVGVTVSNPEPVAQVSNTVVFMVWPKTEASIFLPLIVRN
jgi:hypothetical protein